MQRTNLQMVGVGAVIAMIVVWLLGYFAPDLMSTAPTGLEAGLASLFIALIGAFTDEETTVIGKL